MRAWFRRYLILAEKVVYAQFSNEAMFNLNDHPKESSVCLKWSDYKWGAFLTLQFVFKPNMTMLNLWLLCQ